MRPTSVAGSAACLRQADRFDHHGKTSVDAAPQIRRSGDGFAKQVPRNRRRPGAATRTAAVYCQKLRGLAPSFGKGGPNRCSGYKNKMGTKWFSFRGLTEF